MTCCKFQTGLSTNETGTREYYQYDRPERFSRSIFLLLSFLIRKFHPAHPAKEEDQDQGTDAKPKVAKAKDDDPDGGWGDDDDDDPADNDDDGSEGSSRLCFTPLISLQRTSPPMHLPHTGPVQPSDVRLRVADAFERTVGTEADKSREWARNYLRDTSAATTLRVVTNTEALRFAVTSCNSWDSRTSPSQDSSLDSAFGSASPARGLYDFDEKAEYMFIPHFSSGNLSAGAIISRHTLTSGPLPPAPDDGHLPNFEYRVGRYVRDETTGDMLAMEHHARANSHNTDAPPPGRSVGYFLGCGGSTTSRQHIYFNCDTQRFIEGDLPDCVDWCASSDEVRACYVCGVEPHPDGTAVCACAFPGLVPAHPTHWEVAPLAMKVHTGLFRGRTRVLNRLLSSRGACAETVTDTLFSSMDIRGFSTLHPLHVGTHKNIADILQTFAVQMSLGESSPTRAVMPAGALEREREGRPTAKRPRVDVAANAMVAAAAAAASAVGTAAFGSVGNGEMAKEYAPVGFNLANGAAEATLAFQQQGGTPFSAAALLGGGPSGNANAVAPVVSEAAPYGGCAAAADPSAWRQWQAAARPQQQEPHQLEGQHLSEAESHSQLSSAELSAGRSGMENSQLQAGLAGACGNNLAMWNGVPRKPDAQQADGYGGSSSFVDELRAGSPDLILPLGQLSNPGVINGPPQPQLTGVAAGAESLSPLLIGARKDALQDQLPRLPFALTPPLPSQQPLHFDSQGNTQLHSQSQQPNIHFPSQSQPTNSQFHPHPQSNGQLRHTPASPGLQARPRSHSTSISLSDRVTLLEGEGDTTGAGMDGPPIGAWFEPTRNPGAIDNDVATYPLGFATGDSFGAVAAPGRVGEVAAAAAAGAGSLGSLGSEAVVQPLPGGTAAQPRRPRGSKKPTLEEKVIQDAKRRNKNRESAGRSNKKRKERNDDLKSQLATWKVKKEELEKKHLRLALENTRLKKELKGQRQGVLLV